MNELRTSALRLTQKLLAIDTVQAVGTEGAPFGVGNRKALTTVLAEMGEMGYRTVDLEGYAGYAEKGEGKLFGVLGHLDVVPADGAWTHPPFSATLTEDGVLYGRGTMDDKAPMIAAVFAAEELLKEGFALNCRLRFIFGCNEESGWKCMDRYCKTEEMPEEGFSPDGDFPVIYAEKGVVNYRLRTKKPDIVLSFEAGSRPNIVPDYAVCTVPFLKEWQLEAIADGLQTEVVTTQNGDKLLTLIGKGKAAHGSHPEAGKNAVIAVLKTLAKWDKTADLLYQKLRHINGAGLGLACCDAESGALSFNVGIISTKGDDIFVTLDIRHPISVKRDTITDIINADGMFDLALLAYHDPLYVDPKDPLITQLQAAYQEVTGHALEPLAIGGATYARVLPKGVAFGPSFPGTESTIHQPDERITLAEFNLLIDIYKAAFKRLCFAPVG